MSRKDNQHRRLKFKSIGELEFVQHGLATVQVDLLAAGGVSLISPPCFYGLGGITMIAIAS